jgi:nucleotide-binding universal stress UspA family protein
MGNSKTILVAVDGSDSSRRTVAYVAEMVRGRADFRVGLLHLELPPRMLEWGGSENPEIEDKVESERAEAFGQMEREKIEKAESLLQPLQEILTENGIDAAIRLVQFAEPLDSKSVASAVLATAKEHGCETVVVGRHSFLGWKRFFRHHVGEELVRIGEGITIWVVE